MTETAPSCAFTTGPRVMAGFIGYPAPGCEIKLVPYGDKLEFYCPWQTRHERLLALKMKISKSTVFDEEGFFHTGDAVRLVDVMIQLRA